MDPRTPILPMAMAAALTAGGGAVAQPQPPPPTAYWVCTLEVSVGSRIGTRVTTHGQGLRRYIENNIYLTSFQTRDAAEDWPARRSAYAQAFKEAVRMAGQPVVSEGGAPGEPLCRALEDPASAKAYEQLLRTSPQSGNGPQRVYYDRIEIPWSPGAL